MGTIRLGGTLSMGRMEMSEGERPSNLSGHLLGSRCNLLAKDPVTHEHNAKYSPIVEDSGAVITVKVPEGLTGVEFLWAESDPYAGHKKRSFNRFDGGHGYIVASMKLGPTDTPILTFDKPKGTPVIPAYCSGKFGVFATDM